MSGWCDGGFTGNEKVEEKVKGMVAAVMGFDEEQKTGG